jgi:hypothetical protein
MFAMCPPAVTIAWQMSKLARMSVVTMFEGHAVKFFEGPRDYRADDGNSLFAGSGGSVARLRVPLGTLRPSAKGRRHMTKIGTAGHAPRSSQPAIA